jgi:cytochrome c-type biogenesis protein CcsB
MYNVLFGSYSVAAHLFGLGVILALKKRELPAAALRYAGIAAVVVGLGAALYMMVDAWTETGQPPFKTLYQSLIFFSATTAVVFLFTGFRSSVMGLLTALFVLATLAYGYMKKDAGAVQLPPALQSAWFIPHVVVYFLGYSALFVSFVASILYFIFPRERDLPSVQLFGTKRLDLDQFTYRIVLFGYGMLSAGLILGALWAKFAWGDWWSWDPKENWALITWLVYTAYLHFRLTRRLGPRGLAWLSIIGFLAVMFTYLGVNYLPSAQQALHSYSMQ